MIVEKVRSPKWSSADHIGIDCFVTFTGLGEVPFHAMPTDPEAHGKQIFADLVAGKYGPVAEYVPPPAPTTPGKGGPRVIK